MKPMSAFVCVLSDVQMLAFLLVFHLGIEFSGLSYVQYSDLVGITQEFYKSFYKSFLWQLSPATWELYLSPIWHRYGFSSLRAISTSFHKDAPGWRCLSFYRLEYDYPTLVNRGFLHPHSPQRSSIYDTQYFIISKWTFRHIGSDSFYFSHTLTTTNLLTVSVDLLF